MAMGMGGGKDSSGPQGLGADAFGGEGRSNRIAFYMDDVAIKAKVSPAFKSYKEQIRSLYDAYDPKGQYDHNPHLDSLEPGTYDPGRVSYEQLYNWGLMTQEQYDAMTLEYDGKMPTGKNFPLHEQPGVLEYEMPGLPMEEVTPPPTFNHTLINAVPLNPQVPANMDVEELNWIDMPLPNPDLNSVPTGPGSHGYSGGSSRGI
jgi:hypothetical protein|tara:strand:- start:1417 stop:2025 length:609 start_codon:yes stop_codon:yes gene_type:complete